MNWIYTILLFIFIMIIRFLINYSKFKRIKKLYSEYLKYLQTDNYEFIQHKEEIKTLLKEAGLKDSSVMYQEFIGFGNFVNMKISVFDNLTNKREDIVGNVNNRFNEAIGVFRNRYKESYNPVFWIHFIIKLPQYIFDFFGVLPEKIAVKIFLLIYWIIVILFGLKKIDFLEYLVK